MILNGEDPVFWLHPTTTFSAEDSEGQENDPRLTLATRPSLRQVFIPVPNSNDAAAAAAVAPSTRDLSSSLGRSTHDPTSESNIIRRTPSSESSNILGFTRSSGQFGSMAEAASSSSEQVENDDPFPTLVLAPPPQQQRGSGFGRLGNGRRVSSDPEVCELFRESSSDVRVTTTTMVRGSKVAGFQRWQRKVEGQRSVHGGPTLVASPSSKTFGGGDHVVPGRYRGQLRDLNVIQRPSLDFDKMQRYCLTRVHPTRGISKPRIVKVKCLPGSTSSFSSLGRVIRSELLDPSIFSFRSISQNPSITSSSNRRSSATTPSLSDEN